MSDAKPVVESEGAPAKKKLAGKTLILFIVLPALLILGGGGAAAMMLLGGNKAEAHGEEKPGQDKHAKKGEKDKAAKDKKAKDSHGKDAKGGEAADGAGVITAGDGVAYLSLPQMIVNIAGQDGRQTFLKLKVTLEAADEATLEQIGPAMPEIQDQFQGFLRELRVEDLAGSAGSYRLRLELLRRVNLAAAPATVNAVLIEEMLVQ